MDNLRVMKFGGTSVSDAQRIAAAADIVKKQGAGKPTVVVVSAMAGITNLLVSCAQAAARGAAKELRKNLDTLRHRHEEAAKGLLDPAAQKSVGTSVAAILAEVENTCEGVSRLGHCPPRASDSIVGAGERLSTLLLAAALEKAGVPSKAEEATAFLITDANFGEAAPLMEHLIPKGRERLLPLLEKRVVPVVTGFIGATVDAAPTTLGPGGSEFSAPLLAACLDAAEAWKWTDWEGTFGADRNW